MCLYVVYEEGLKGPCTFDEQAERGVSLSLSGAPCKGRFY